MKPIFLAVAATALVAFAGTLAAQPATMAPPQAVPPAAWNDRGPANEPQADWPDNGPQGTWMAQHGYTVNDTLPPDPGDMYSDHLNAEAMRQATSMTIRPPLRVWEAPPQ